MAEIEMDFRRRNIYSLFLDSGARETEILVYLKNRAIECVLITPMISEFAHKSRR